jgi:triosephosphate isomerase
MAASVAGKSMTRRTLAAGNWKMNGNYADLSEVTALY